MTIVSIGNQIGKPQQTPSFSGGVNRRTINIAQGTSGVAGGANGSGTILGGANGSGTISGGANGSGTISGGANGSGTILGGANGSGTVTGGANGSGTVSGGANGSGTILGGANGSGTVTGGANGSGLGSIKNSIKGIYKKVMSGSSADRLSKLLGAVTLASIIYDSHINGKENAIVKSRKDMADRFEYDYNQFMTLDKRSQTIADLKGMWFRTKINYSWPDVVSNISGYTSGVFQTIANNAPEIMLSVLALKTKNLPFIGKIAGGLLGINALKIMLFDVVGFGKFRE